MSTATDIPEPSVTRYLTWDHDRLHRTLLGVCEALQGRRLDEAWNRYRDFEERLRRHLRIEEELLLPLFEARAGISGGTGLMRDEHREILRAVETLGGGLTAPSREVLENGLRFLVSLLPEHNAREEHLLYPALDRLLSDAERTTLLERLQRE